MYVFFSHHQSQVQVNTLQDTKKKITQWFKPPFPRVNYLGRSLRDETNDGMNQVLTFVFEVYFLAHADKTSGASTSTGHEDDDDDPMDQDDDITWNDYVEEDETDDEDYEEDETEDEDDAGDDTEDEEEAEDGTEDDDEDVDDDCEVEVFSIIGSTKEKGTR